MKGYIKESFLTTENQVKKAVTMLQRTGCINIKSSRANAPFEEAVRVEYLKPSKK